MKDGDGRPLMTLADISLPEFSMPSVGLPGSPDDAEDQEAAVAVYRWQDEQGVWHFSDNLNPDGQSEIINVQLNSSVMSPDIIELPGQPVPQGEADKNILDPGFIPVLHASEALQQARDVEGLLQRRFQRQEAAF